MKNFSELPEHFVQEITKHEPTGYFNQDAWHEVQFYMDGIIVQVAVVNHKYVALPKDQVNRLTRIVKIMEKL